MTAAGRNSVGYGALIGLVILAFHGLGLVLFRGSEFVLFLLFPALTQLPVVLFLTSAWDNEGRRESSKGLALMAGLIALGNTACVGWALNNISH